MKRRSASVGSSNADAFKHDAEASIMSIWSARAVQILACVEWVSGRRRRNVLRIQAVERIK
jgi:hypothetical protein